MAAAAWPNVPHEAADLSTALHRLSESVHACRTTLSARADLDLEVDADVQVFTAVIDGVIIAAACALFGLIFWKLAAFRPPVVPSIPRPARR